MANRVIVAELALVPSRVIAHPLQRAFAGNDIFGLSEQLLSCLRVVSYALKIEIVIVFVDRLVERPRDFHLVHIYLHLRKVLWLACQHALPHNGVKALGVVRFLFADVRYFGRVWQT